MAELEFFQRDVVTALRSRGYVTAEWYHSGGGIMGVWVARRRTHLFGTLEQDGDRLHWTGFDMSDEEGNLIACVEIQVRPFGTPDEANAPTVDAMVSGIVRLLEVLR